MTKKLNSSVRDMFTVAEANIAQGLTTALRNRYNVTAYKIIIIVLMNLCDILSMVTSLSLEQFVRFNSLSCEPGALSMTKRTPASDTLTTVYTNTQL